MVWTACNLGQDAESLSTFGIRTLNRRVRNSFTGTASWLPVRETTYDDARLATSSLRPGPIVEETETFLT